jgi:Mn2+/Fe2+ NRAMP family transporter
MLYVNQEMMLRLGAVTGVGQVRMILERFGRFWGACSSRSTFAGTAAAGHYTDAAGLASGLAAYAGKTAGALFAVALLDAALIAGAAAIVLRPGRAR